MRRRIAVGLALLGMAIAADAQWIQIATRNFELFTDAGESEARDLIRQFERVRSFFRQVIPGATAPTPRTRIVAFRSFQDYEPYRPSELAVAHYLPTSDNDYVVMGEVSVDAYSAGIREYVRLLARDASLRLPLWLSEGIAELYSNMTAAGENVLVGSVIEARRKRLLERLDPLAEILGARSTHQSENFYHAAWAFTHMLALTPQYGPKFAQVVVAVSAGTPSERALEQIYGKPLSKIELEWRAYLTSETFQGVLIPAKRDGTGDKLLVEPVNDFDLSLALSRISKPGATRTTLNNLIRTNPQRFEPYEALAYLDLSQGQTDRAREDFQQAYVRAGRNPRMLWDYAKLTQSKDPKRAMELFRNLLEIQPERLDARMELASLQFQSHQVEQAIETLEPVTTVANEDAPKFLTLLARLHLAAGNREKARNAAEQLKKVAVFAADRELADQLLAAIESQPSKFAPVITVRKDEDAPLLKHQAPVEDEPVIVRRKDSDPKLPTFTGTFAELRCSEQVKIVMETADGKRILLIDDPRKLLVNGDDAAVLDLSCGPQNKIRISIEYEVPGKYQGVDGVARIIHVHP